VPEPNAPAPDAKGGGFLMKKWGPLPIAAYIVAGAALLGYLILRNKSTTSASTTSPGPVAAPTGIVDPTTDPAAQLAATLNAIESQLTNMQAAGSVGSTTGTPGTPSGMPLDLFQTWTVTNWSGTSPQARPSTGFDRWVSDLLGQYQTSTGQKAVGTTQTPSGSYTTTDPATYGWLSNQWQQTHPTTPPTKAGPIGPWSAQGGGEAPQRILPDTFMAAPTTLGTQMTRRPPVVTR
jgi:hypothetical protein